MRLINHQNDIDALPPSPIKTHIQASFNQLSEDTDVPPNLILVETNDDITGPSRPYEWASYLPSLQLYEVLLLVNNEDGYWIMIPATVVDSHSDLHWVLTSKELGGLSEPQPLY